MPEPDGPMMHSRPGGDVEIDPIEDGAGAVTLGQSTHADHGSSMGPVSVVRRGALGTQAKAGNKFHQCPVEQRGGEVGGDDGEAHVADHLASDLGQLTDW